MNVKFNDIAYLMHGGEDGHPLGDGSSVKYGREERFIIWERRRSQIISELITEARVVEYADTATGGECN